MQRQIIPDIINNQDVHALPETATVFETAQKLLDLNVAALVVVDDGGGLLGIVTERDMTRRVVAKGLDPKTTAVKDIMTADPDTLGPDDSALDALELMRTRRYRHIPVVDDGRVVGMVSIRDLYETVKADMEQNMRETEAFVFGDRYGA
jgi:CBS domain-containing protein